MARPRRAKRVRYAEDSDAEVDYDPSSVKRSARGGQRPQTYRELSTDTSDLDRASAESASDSSRPSTPRNQSPAPEGSRTTRSRRRPQTYREPSTDGSDLERPVPVAISRPAIRSRQTQPLARPKNARKAHHRGRQRTKATNFTLFKKIKPNIAGLIVPGKPIVFPLGPSGKRPPWQTLPYEVLVAVMKHAAYPLYGHASRPTGSIEWLCRVSLLCRSFHDACMAALLYSPPLYPAWRGEDLLRLLRRDQSNLMSNYQTKIKQLNIEVKNLLVSKNDIELRALIECTPNLEHLHLYHNHDDLSRYIWAQPSASLHRRWTYPDELFETLDTMNIRLKSFGWNGRFPTPMDVLARMAEFHSRPSFSTIETLTLANISFPEKHPEADLAAAREHLASALRSLPNLTSLTFRTCNILDEVTTPRLPYSLKHLEITNNIIFLSSHLTSYLATRGSHLHTLTLKHNQSMSLDFLANLRTYTPRLRHLTLDLTYSDPSSYQDVSPLFDEALPDGPPMWPAALVSIDIENLRQISCAETESFFTSLVEAADDLKSLRRLVIRAIVKDAGWKERASLRQKWEPVLADVFLDRRTPEVRKSVMSDKERLRREFKVRVESDDKIVVPKTQADGVLPLIGPVAPTKGNSDSPVNAPVPDGEDQAESNSKSRRSGRIRDVHLKRLAYEAELSASAAEEDDQTSNALTSTLKLESKGLPHQRRCNVVQLQLSDQRPAQDQYRETDFMDEEPSGDEDYRER